MADDPWAAFPLASQDPWAEFPVADKKKPFTLADTWPAKIAKSIFSGLTLPGDVMAGRAQLPSSGAVPGSVEFGDPESSGERVADLAGLAAPMAPRAAATAVTRRGAPSADKLKEVAVEGFESARNMGVDINPASVAKSAGDLMVALERDGINAELAPKTFSIISKLTSPPAESVVTIGNLHTFRRTLGNAAKDFANPTEQAAANQAIKHFDGYLSGLHGSDVVAGDAAQAAGTLRNAIGNYATSKRSATITNAADTAELNAAAANSGQNVGNATRQRLKSILNSDKQSRGFSPDELARMEGVVRGTTTGNTARMVGNLLGGGGGLGAAIAGTIGGVATAPMGGWGAAAPLVGMLLKQGEKASVNRQTRMLDESVRSRSPLAEQTKQSGLTPIEEARRTALVRLLLEFRPELSR